MYLDIIFQYLLLDSNFMTLYHVIHLSQISYSLVVILELSGVLEVQYKEIMMSSINKNN